MERQIGSRTTVEQCKGQRAKLGCHRHNQRSRREATDNRHEPTNEDPQCVLAMREVQMALGAQEMKRTNTQKKKGGGGFGGGDEERRGVPC